MADNSVLNPGVGGDTVRTNDRSGIKTPVVMLDLGSDGTESIVDGTVIAPSALLPVTAGIIKRLTQTPTVSTTPAYTASPPDAVGGLLTFSNAARVSGGGIIIEAAVLYDLASQAAPLELVLFDRTFTNSSDNAAFDPTDGDLANIIGVIPFNIYSAFNDNSVCSVRGVGITAKLNGTDLFGQLLTRGTPTYASTSDIMVCLHVRQM